MKWFLKLYFLKSHFIKFFIPNEAKLFAFFGIIFAG